jgi:ribokinase
VILLQPSGENSIVIVGGANQAPWQLSEDARRLVQAAGAVLLQREIPEAVNAEVAALAAAAGVPVILDAGGVEAPVGEALLRSVSVLSPNETELERLAGCPTADLQQVGPQRRARRAARGARRAAHARFASPAARPLPTPCPAAPCPARPQVQAAAGALQQRGVAAVLVKLGSDGSLLVPPGGEGPLRQRAFPVDKVVDTTGAGDCFTAAFAVATLEGRTYGEALRFASAAAALCVQQPGAMPSLPLRGAVEALLQQQQGGE